jgi:hypothetical protein
VIVSEGNTWGNRMIELCAQVIYQHAGKLGTMLRSRQNHSDNCVVLHNEAHVTAKVICCRNEF